MSNPQSVEFLPVDNLEFDPENPRLPSHIKHDNDETKILSWMVNKGVIEELMIAIGEYGYFIGEPLLVVKKTKTKKTYQVIEGNRRLAALKFLLNPNLADRKSIHQIVSEVRNQPPTTVPCVIFPTRDDILRYLGYRHVTGIREWSALSKARYLNQLYQSTQEGSLEEKYKELARAIGSRKDYVARLLTGLALYNNIEENNFFDIEGLDEDTLSFSILTTASNYANIVKFLGLEDPKNPDLEGLKLEQLKKLSRWLFEKDNGKTKIGESRNLRMLNKVVAHKLALNRFEKGDSLNEVFTLTEFPEDDENNTTGQFRAAISSVKSNLSTADTLVDSATDLVEDDITDMKEIHQKVIGLEMKVTKFREDA